MSARYRHEDVEAVPRGWKVRTVKAGSHRVRVAFPPGRRMKGSGRLVSVLHPLSGSNPCANPCTLRSTNPQELLVMGANPPRKHRRNAANEGTVQRLIEIYQNFRGSGLAHREAILQTLTHYSANDEDRQEFKRRVSRRGFGLNASSSYSKAVGMGYPFPRGDGHVAPDGETWLSRFTKTSDGTGPALYVGWSQKKKKWIIEHSGNPNPAELLVLGANPRVEVVHSANPPTEEIVEGFTGQDAEWLDVYNEPHMPRGRYAQLGPLIALYIKPAKGGQVQRIGAPEAVGHDFPKSWGGKPPIVVCDSSARQIYFVDGAQDLTDALATFAGDHQGGLVTLGQVRRIDYQCRKEHVATPDEDLWKHEHGEENGVLPTVLFDTKNKRLIYEGGDYRIEGPWIRN